MKDQSKTKQTLVQKKASLDKASEYAESIIDTVREPLIILDQDLRVVTASRSFYEFFKVKPEETERQLIYNLGNKQWDIPKLRELLETILPQKTTFDNYEVEHDFVTIGRRIMLLNARQIKRALGKKRIILLAIEDITERKKAEEALRESKHRYQELSIIDDLTQLYNSRHFYAQLEREIERSNRYEQPLTLLMLDLDKFKKFNDKYGHVEGDCVLSQFGQVIKRCLRETDSAYRYGGEEFTIILPMTAREEGIVTTKRIQTELRKKSFSPALGQEVYITVSIGLSQYKPKEEVKAFVHRIDHLMYQAKKNGRDRIYSEL
jgi:diguanylate cyclase (GGDEF)-like protein/PAS domain S-box-containing protein